MKGFICFFVIFVINIVLVPKAVSAPDTVKVAVTKSDSNKTASGMVSVDKETFTIALNSANATIEFLKWFLGTALTIAAFIISVMTAYFAWRAIQDTAKIKNLEARLTDAEKRASKLTDIFRMLQEQVQQTTERVNNSVSEAFDPKSNLSETIDDTNSDAVSGEPQTGA
jgi:hypothetical protein